MNGLKNRGVQDILIAVVDGPKGFPEAITAAFPETARYRAAPNRTALGQRQVLENGRLINPLISGG